MKFILTDVEDDGFHFDSDSITIQDITQQAEYVGLRVTFKGKLDSIQIYMDVVLSIHCNVDIRR